MVTNRDSTCEPSWIRGGEEVVQEDDDDDAKDDTRGRPRTPAPVLEDDDDDDDTSTSTRTTTRTTTAIDRTVRVCCLRRHRRRRGVRGEHRWSSGRARGEGVDAECDGDWCDDDDDDDDDDDGGLNVDVCTQIDVWRSSGRPSRGDANDAVDGFDAGFGVVDEANRVRRTLDVGRRQRRRQYW